MRALVYFAVAAGLLAHVGARGQTAGTKAANAPGDLAGVYVGAQRPFIEPDVYPFTPAGEQAHEAYDPLTGDPRQYDDCAGESVPAVLWAGTVSNMSIAQEEEDKLQLLYEHGGAVRTIHMDGSAPAADQPHTRLGYSVGRWDGDVLVIETTHLEPGVVFTNRGYPLSEQTRLTERYSRDAENDLHMEILVEDPVNYTETFTLGREWIFSPDEQVIPWNCVSLGGRGGEADIDELRRILNNLE